MLEGGEERDLKKWIECGLGGCLIKNGGSLGLLVERLGELTGRGYGLFPGISHVKKKVDTLYIAKSAFCTHGARAGELRTRWTGAVNVP